MALLYVLLFVAVRHVYTDFDPSQTLMQADLWLCPGARITGFHPYRVPELLSVSDVRSDERMFLFARAPTIGWSLIRFHVFRLWGGGMHAVGWVGSGDIAIRVRPIWPADMSAILLINQRMEVR